MAKRAYLLLLTFLLLAGGSNLSSQTNVVTKRVVVDAKKAWQDSGIVLKADQYYSVSAWGTWISGYSRVYGPEGAGTGTITDCALVGWIAKDRPAQLDYESYKKEIVGYVIRIGREGTFKSYAKGTLWLAIGDWSGCKECSGSLEVLITLYE